jgi:hypothetical protein
VLAQDLWGSSPDYNCTSQNRFLNSLFSYMTEHLHEDSF